MLAVSNLLLFFSYIRQQEEINMNVVEKEIQELLERNFKVTEAFLILDKSRGTSKFVEAKWKEKMKELSEINASITQKRLELKNIG